MQIDHIKYRSMGVQVVLMFLTLGFYGVYWYYVTLDELHKANGKNDPMMTFLWTLLTVIPFANLLASWHHASEFNQFTEQTGIWTFFLWVFPFGSVFLNPIPWLLVQRALNVAAEVAAEEREQHDLESSQ